MTDIPSFPYGLVGRTSHNLEWQTVTRRDGEEKFSGASRSRRVPVKTNTETFPLEKANTALDRFRAGQLSATAVLMIGE